MGKGFGKRVWEKLCGERFKGRGWGKMKDKDARTRYKETEMLQGKNVGKESDEKGVGKGYAEEMLGKVG